MFPTWFVLELLSGLVNEPSTDKDYLSPNILSSCLCTACVCNLKSHKKSVWFFFFSFKKKKSELQDFCLLFNVVLAFSKALFHPPLCPSSCWVLFKDELHIAGFAGAGLCSGSAKYWGSYECGLVARPQPLRQSAIKWHFLSAWHELPVTSKPKLKIASLVGGNKSASLQSFSDFWLHCGWVWRNPLISYRNYSI